MKNILDRRNIITVIKSYQDDKILLKVTDYVYDEESNKVYIAAIYNNKSYTLQVKNDYLDQEEFPNTFGQRYVIIDGYLFFINNAKDILGVF